MKKVICFGVCDSNYIDMVRVALYSFYKFNDLEMKIFLTDDSDTTYKEVFKDYDFFDKLEFINFCNGTKTKEYIKKHFDDFKTFAFCFDKKGILNVTIANEVTDYMYEHYGKDYQVILRLDYDVMFFNNVEPSIDNFIKSGKRLGGCQEAKYFMEDSRNKLNLKNYINCDIYLNAGNFMYRTDLMYHDQFNRMCNLFETLGFERFHYFDQDTVNIMYQDSEKYNANFDGWIISVIPADHYGRFFVKNIKPINIHFVGVTKPFVDAEKYSENNINERKENCFSLFFPFYLKYAEEAGCSKDFCARIKKNYERFKKWNLDEDSTHAQTALLYLLKRIIERE